MIIVSQDKETIVNFDNIVKIWLEKPLDDDKDTEIIVESDDIMETIGYYTTEERAKEVLREIMMKYLEYGSIEDGLRNVKDVVVMPRVYEMPKE